MCRAIGFNLISRQMEAAELRLSVDSEAELTLRVCCTFSVDLTPTNATTTTVQAFCCTLYLFHLSPSVFSSLSPRALVCVPACGDLTCTSLCSFACFCTCTSLPSSTRLT